MAIRHGRIQTLHSRTQQISLFLPAGTPEQRPRSIELEYKPRCVGWRVDGMSIFKKSHKSVEWQGGNTRVACLARSRACTGGTRLLHASAISIETTIGVHVFLISATSCTRERLLWLPCSSQRGRSLTFKWRRAAASVDRCQDATVRWTSPLSVVCAFARTVQNLEAIL